MTTATKADELGELILGRHRDKYLRWVSLCLTLFCFYMELWVVLGVTVLFVLNVPLNKGFSKLVQLWMWCLTYIPIILCAWNVYSLTFCLSHTEIPIKVQLLLKPCLSLGKFFCIMRNEVNMMMLFSLPLNF